MIFPLLFINFKINHILYMNIDFFIKKSETLLKAEIRYKRKIETKLNSQRAYGDKPAKQTTTITKNGRINPNGHSSGAYHVPQCALQYSYYRFPGDSLLSSHPVNSILICFIFYSLIELFFVNRSIQF